MFSADMYEECYLVERFLNKLKYFRRLATRYGKLSRHFLVMERLWLCVHESLA